MKLGKIGYKIGKAIVGSKSLEPKVHESEAIASLSYDAESQQATCHFHQRGSYVYYDMDPTTFMEWNNAGSRGIYFNLYVKDRYSYEKM